MENHAKNTSYKTNVSSQYIWAKTDNIYKTTLKSLMKAKVELANKSQSC
jgi:hypothetical protein